MNEVTLAAVVTSVCHAPSAPALRSMTKPLSSPELSCQLNPTCVELSADARRLFGATGGGTAGATLVSLSQLKFPIEPLGAASSTSRIPCAPPESGMPLLVIVLQIWYAPVLGTIMAPVTLTPSIST